MARELRFYERPSTLERPVLIGAFRGWNGTERSEV